ncbi:tubulin monoglycylase TTLL3-like isoform X1 [Lates japonicus]
MHGCYGNCLQEHEGSRTEGVYGQSGRVTGEVTILGLYINIQCKVFVFERRFGDGFFACRIVVTDDSGSELITSTAIAPWII